MVLANSTSRLWTACETSADGTLTLYTRLAPSRLISESSKMGALGRTVIHDNEEYGYMSVYLRLKGVVPPSSEGR